MLGGCTEWSDCLEPTLEANTRTSKYPRFVDLLSCFLRRRLERCTLRPADSGRGWSARAVALIGRDPAPLTNISSHSPIGRFQFRAGGIVP